MNNSLPKFSITTYSCTLPSNGKQIEFRPYVVKEEKELLKAIAEKDDDLIYRSMRNLINGCVIGESREFDAFKLPTFDMEFLFLQIRSKSVGESVTFLVTCTEKLEGSDSECGNSNKVSVDLSTMTPPPDTRTTKISLGKDYGVTLRPYTTETISKLAKKYKNDKQKIDYTYELIASCIDTIWTKDQVFNTADYSDSEIAEFVDNLNSLQFDGIKEYVQNTPTLSHTVTITCPKCGKTYERTFSGPEDFFG